MKDRVFIRRKREKPQVDTVREPARSLPVIARCDVAVVGAGIAGVAAALAASRNGAKVILIEKENMCGGLATLGMVLWYLPLCDGNGRQVMAGIAEELLKSSLRYGPGKIPDAWQEGGDIAERKKNRYRLLFNPAAFACALDELLLESRVEIMFDTRFCGVIKKKQGAISSLIVENKSGRSAVECCMAIDASGDADLCSAAGEAVSIFAWNRLSAWFYYYKDGEVKLFSGGEGRYLDPPRRGEHVYNGLAWNDVSKINLDTRKLLLSMLEEIRQEKKDSEVYPVTIPSLPLFRMTRRLKGRYVLGESDVKRRFHDSIGVIGDWRKPGPIFFLPFRLLAGVKTPNLLTAGRTISTTVAMWDMTRVIPVCAVTGQAAGTAAALAVSTGKTVRTIDIRKLQEMLLAQGVLLAPRL